MKKLKLFMAALALVGWGVSADAQKDVTSQYITNATLSNGTNGWTVSNFNAPKKGNNTVGYASEAYAGWDNLTVTSYSLTQEIILPAGNYTLVNYSFFRYGLNADTDASKSLAYLKAGNEQVAIKTLGGISAAGYANSQEEGANCFDSKMYRNTVDFTIDSDDTKIEIGLVGTFDLKQSWCIAGMFELIDNDTEATMDSPFDVTGYLTNPGFEYRNMEGWTLENSGDLSNDYIFQTQNNTAFGNKSGGYYGEAWQASGGLSDRTMSQSLSDLPNGYYKLSLYASYGGNGAYIFVNDKKTAVEANNSKQYTVGCVINDGNLNVGVGLEGGTANYFAFDRFSLQFCGDVTAALTTLLEQVSDYNGVIPTAAYSALETSVKEYDKTYTEVDDILAAIDAVTALYAAADELKTPYADWLKAKAAAQTVNVTPVNNAVTTLDATVEAATTAAAITEATTSLTEMTNVGKAWLIVKEIVDHNVAASTDDETAKATLSTALAAQSAAVEEATTAAAVTGATATLKEANNTYVLAATPTAEGDTFNCTTLLTNANLEGLPTWTGAEGWYTEQSDGNSQVMTNDKATSEDGTKTAFYEYWSYNAKANDLFTLYQKVTLPEGTYTMSCYAFAKQQDGEADKTPVSGVFFYANDTQGSVVDTDRLSEKTLSFVNDTEQEVKIGLKAVSSGNTYNWMGIGYVELYKVPAQAYQISEDADYDTTQEGAGAVELKRTIVADTWNSIWLPFSMTEDELKATFGDDVQIAEYVETANGTDSSVKFVAKETPAISPNVPVLLKTSTAGTSYEIEGRTIVAGTPTTGGTNYEFVGTTAASTKLVEGDYFVNGGKLYRSTGLNTIKGTRAYIKAIAAGARIVKFDIDGAEATAIQNLENGTVTTGKVFNLQGQEVKSAQKGVFIQNGKKVVLK